MTPDFKGPTGCHRDTSRSPAQISLFSSSVLKTGRAASRPTSWP